MSATKPAHNHNTPDTEGSSIMGPSIMGIVNVTPDSFSDGGQYRQADIAIQYGLRLLDEGATCLDIGGESTRPGAKEVPAQEELARVLPVIEGLCAQTKALISVDTRKADVAVAAIEAGASIWNDVSALTFDANSLAVAARLECDIVLMHAQGLPETMQDNPHYDGVVDEVKKYLSDRVAASINAGIARERLIIDPGIGFGKTTEHNLELIRHLDVLTQLGLPILFGASRKRMIAALDRENDTDDRLGGSLALALEAANKGAAIVRVHDVAQTRQALSVWKALHC